MNIRYLTAFIALIFCTGTSVPAHELTANEQTKIHAGSILVSVEKLEIEGEKLALVDSHILINASPEMVWAVMTDCARGPDYVPGLISCEVMETGPKTKFGHEWDIRRHKNKAGFMLPTIITEFRSEFTYPSRVTVSGTDGDLRVNEAEWHILPAAGGTASYVSYQAKVAADTLLPDSLLRRTMRSNLPKVLGALRDEVEANLGRLSED